jgi:hypothetical protein
MLNLAFIMKSKNNHSIQAITNAKLLTAESNSMLNIAIKNHKIIALGYLPDDDDVEEINVCHHFILNNIFNLGAFINNQPCSTESNTSLKNLNSFDIIDSYELIQQVNSKTVSSSKKCLISSISLSELLFLIQETNKHPLPIHCHLILNQIDNETCDLLNSTEFPENISIGIYLTESSTQISSSLESLILAKKITSLSSHPSNPLATLIMTTFPENYKKIYETIFINASNKIFDIKATPIEIGKKINAVFVLKKPPHTVTLTITDGIIKHIKGDH